MPAPRDPNASGYASAGGVCVKVTLLGHATVLVETGPMRIVMDPGLQDPFENGMVVSCPSRVIDLDRLGPMKRRIDHEITQLRELRD